MKNLRKRINEAVLTKTEKKIAAYVLENLTTVCFMTSTDLAVELSVGEATIIRFVKTLGFHGYKEFQKNLQELYQSKVASISSTVTEPAKRFAESCRIQMEGGNLLGFFECSVSNLKSALSENNEDDFLEAAHMIIHSQRKYIVASRANSGAGSYCCLLLKHMLPFVISTNDEALNVIDHLCHIDEKDCVIAICFPRYSALDEAALRLAKDAGAKVILITDRQSSPFAKYTDLLLTVQADSPSFFNSYIGPQFIVEVLCSMISHQVSGVEERLDKIDEYLNPLRLF